MHDHLHGELTPEREINAVITGGLILLTQKRRHLTSKYGCVSVGWQSWVVDMSDIPQLRMNSINKLSLSGVVILRKIVEYVVFWG